MTEAKREPEAMDVPLAVMGVVFLALGASLSYFGYFWGIVIVNPSELFGSVLFWAAVIVLALAFPLRGATRSFFSYVRSAAGAAIFAAYLAIHLLLYGFLLEEMVTVASGGAGLSTGPSLLVTTNDFLPPSLPNTGFDLAYNPSITIDVPPHFGAALSLYGVSVALIIATLVVASVGETRRLGGMCPEGKKARTYVALPAAGIVLGASCCLSVAGIVSLAVPSASLLTSVAWVYYATYFLFPLVAIVLLYLNLRSIDAISRRLASSYDAEAPGRAAGAKIRL